MNELPRDLCRMLKEAGYPQDRWPQMIWGRERGYRPFQDAKDYRPYYLKRSPNPEEYIDWVACPPVITADGKGGWLPWLAGKLGGHIELIDDPRRGWGPKWWLTIYEDSMSLVGVHGGIMPADGVGPCDTPEDLLRQCLEKMKED